MNYNSLKSTLIVILVIFITINKLSAQTVEVFPTGANFISEKEPKKVFSKSEVLKIKGQKGYKRGIFLKFGNITFENKPIQKAELVMECLEMGSESKIDVSITVGEVSDKWVPDELTWANSPKPESVLGGTIVKTGGPVAIDITDFVKRLAKKKDGGGFSLVLADLKKGNRNVVFAGLENAQKKPKIIIKYK